MTASTATVPGPAPAPSASRASTAGLPTLVRLAVRRDRIMLPVWIYALAASVGSTAYSLKQLYPTQADRDGLAASIATNPSLRALYGPIYDTHTLGALTAWRVMGFVGLLLGVMVVLLVTRHTRAEEESGRLELLGSTAIGRSAPLTAALYVALAASLTVGAVAAIIMALLGEGWAGALCFGAALCGVGAVFTGAQAVAAQVTETGRGANGIGTALLGIAFLIRTVGDAGDPGSGLSTVAWLSPLGWAERVHPWHGDRWWIVVLMLAVAGLEIAAAYRLAGSRDLGSGLLPQRPGPATAGPGLRTVHGLGHKLQRPSLYGWLAGMLVFGMVLGSIAKGIESLLNGSRQASDIIARYGGASGLTDAYLVTCMTFLAMAGAVYGVQSVLRLRAEETSGRAEPLLAAGVSRAAWATSHVVYPAFGSVLLMLAGGLGTGIGAGAVLGDLGGWVGRMLVSGLAQVPAVWVFAAAGLALFGLVPKYTSAAWGVLAVLLLIAYLGPAIDLGQWFLDLTPFTHIPRIPGGTFQWVPILWLVGISAVLTAAGYRGLQRRDVTA